jgi:hypothetical protein
MEWTTRLYTETGKTLTTATLKMQCVESVLMDPRSQNFSFGWLLNPTKHNEDINQKKITNQWGFRKIVNSFSERWDDRLEVKLLCNLPFEFDCLSIDFHSECVALIFSTDDYTGSSFYWLPSCFPWFDIYWKQLRKEVVTWLPSLVTIDTSVSWVYSASIVRKQTTNQLVFNAFWVSEQEGRQNIHFDHSRLLFQLEWHDWCITEMIHF